MCEADQEIENPFKESDLDRLIAIFAGVIGTGFLAFLRWDALRTGIFPGRGAVVYRDEHPRIFRAGIAMLTVLTVSMAIWTVAIAFGILPIQL